MGGGGSGGKKSNIFYHSNGGEGGKGMRRKKGRTLLTKFLCSNEEDTGESEIISQEKRGKGVPST